MSVSECIPRAEQLIKPVQLRLRSATNSTSLSYQFDFAQLPVQPFARSKDHCEGFDISPDFFFVPRPSQCAIRTSLLATRLLSLLRQRFTSLCIAYKSFIFILLSLFFRLYSFIFILYQTVSAFHIL